MGFFVPTLTSTVCTIKVSKSRALGHFYRKILFRPRFNSGQGLPIRWATVLHQCDGAVLCAKWIRHRRGLRPRRPRQLTRTIFSRIFSRLSPLGRKNSFFSQGNGEWQVLNISLTIDYVNTGQLINSYEVVGEELIVVLPLDNWTTYTNEASIIVQHRVLLCLKHNLRTVFRANSSFTWSVILHSTSQW